MARLLPKAERDTFRPWFYYFFEKFVAALMRRAFARFELIGELPPLPEPGIPLLFLANHISWWDGFFLWRLQQRWMRRSPIYTVMLAGEFQKFSFFGRVGALPLTLGSPASLRCLLRLLQKLRLKHQARRWSLSYFAQGRIRPSFSRPLALSRGVLHAAEAMSPSYIIPVALHIEFLNKQRPTVFMQLGQARYYPDPTLTLEELELELTQTLDGIHRLVSEFGEDYNKALDEKGMAHACLL